MRLLVFSCIENFVSWARKIPQGCVPYAEKECCGSRTGVREAANILEGAGKELELCDS